MNLFTGDDDNILIDLDSPINGGGDLGSIQEEDDRPIQMATLDSPGAVNVILLFIIFLSLSLRHLLQTTAAV